MHGGATPAVRAAAERRRIAAEATALLNVVWDPDAAPITDPVTALQSLAGRLHHAADVLGARLDAVDLDSPTGLAWARVLRELRQALIGMEKLNLAEKQVALEQDKARMVAVAVSEAMDAVEMSPGDRETFTRVMLARMRLVDAAVPGQVTA